MEPTNMEQRITRLETEMENLASAFQLHERKQDGEFNSIGTQLTEIQKQLALRLPTWATLLMTGMGTVIGILIGVVSTHSIN